MNNAVIFEGIRQLIKIYACTESQFCYASLLERSPVIREFLEFRAYERMYFIEELEYSINLDSSKTYEGLCDWYVQVYGHSPLNGPVVLPFEISNMEINALELCEKLLKLDLPESLDILLWKHLCKIEACLLSMAYLSALFEKRY
jgi:hypothetical protein